MRIAIIGAGNWGRHHVRVFCQLLGNSNVCVCDPDKTRRDAALQDYPGVSVAANTDWESADGVVIATPAELHFEIAKRALFDRKHVLVEKPLALASDQAEELIDIAESVDRILMVDHLLEYHPAVVRLKELVRSGELGRIYHMTSQRLNLGVIRSEENALWSLAPHDISVMLYLLEEEPCETLARGEVYLQEGIEDMSYVTLRFPSGSLGLIHTSWLDPVKTRRLTVVGDKRMAVFDDMAADKLVVYEHAIEQFDGRFRTTRGEATTVDIDGTEPLVRMARAFLTSVETGKKPLSDGEDGLRVVRVLEAAQQSMEQGKG